MRRQRRSPIARPYDADNPATAMDTMLLKAVDEPRIIRERRVEIAVVATIVATGMNVRGLTCEAQQSAGYSGNSNRHNLQQLHQRTFTRVL